MRNLRITENDSRYFRIAWHPSCWDYFLLHKDALKRMWNEQKQPFWVNLVIKFRIYVFKHGHFSPFLGEATNGCLDHPFLYILKKLTSKFSDVVDLLADIHTVSSAKEYFVNMEKQSCTYDPFFMPNSRSSFRNMFGEPDNRIRIYRTHMFHYAFSLFGGALMELLQEWKSLADLPSGKVVEWSAPEDYLQSSLLPVSIFEQYLKNNWPKKISVVVGAPTSEVVWWDQLQIGGSTAVPIKTEFRSLVRLYQSVEDQLKPVKKGTAVSAAYKLATGRTASPATGRSTSAHKTSAASTKGSKTPEASTTGSKTPAASTTGSKTPSVSTTGSKTPAASTTGSKTPAASNGVNTSVNGHTKPSTASSDSRGSSASTDKAVPRASSTVRSNGTAENGTDSSDRVSRAANTNGRPVNGAQSGDGAAGSRCAPEFLMKVCLPYKDQAPCTVAVGDNMKERLVWAGRCLAEINHIGLLLHDLLKHSPAHEDIIQSTIAKNQKSLAQYRNTVNFLKSSKGNRRITEIQWNNIVDRLSSVVNEHQKSLVESWRTMRQSSDAWLGQQSRVFGWIMRFFQRTSVCRLPSLYELGVDERLVIPSRRAYADMSQWTHIINKTEVLRKESSSSWTRRSIDRTLVWLEDMSRLRDGLFQLDERWQTSSRHLYWRRQQRVEKAVLPSPPSPRVSPRRWMEADGFNFFRRAILEVSALSLPSYKQLWVGSCDMPSALPMDSARLDSHPFWHPLPHHAQAMVDYYWAMLFLTGFVTDFLGAIPCSHSLVRSLLSVRLNQLFKFTIAVFHLQLAAERWSDPLVELQCCDKWVLPSPANYSGFTVHLRLAQEALHRMTTALASLMEDFDSHLIRLRTKKTSVPHDWDWPTVHDGIDLSSKQTQEDDAAQLNDRVFGSTFNRARLNAMTRYLLTSSLTVSVTDKFVDIWRFRLRTLVEDSCEMQEMLRKRETSSINDSMQVIMHLLREGRSLPEDFTSAFLKPMCDLSRYQTMHEQYCYTLINRRNEHHMPLPAIPYSCVVKVTSLMLNTAMIHHCADLKRNKRPFDLARASQLMELLKKSIKPSLYRPRACELVPSAGRPRVFPEWLSSSNEDDSDAQRRCLWRSWLDTALSRAADSLRLLTTRSSDPLAGLACAKCCSKWSSGGQAKSKHCCQTTSLPMATRTLVLSGVACLSREAMLYMLPDGQGSVHRSVLNILQGSVLPLSLMSVRNFDVLGGWSNSLFMAITELTYNHTVVERFSAIYFEHETWGSGKLRHVDRSWLFSSAPLTPATMTSRSISWEQACNLHRRMMEAVLVALCELRTRYKPIRVAEGELHPVCLPVLERVELGAVLLLAEFLPYRDGRYPLNRVDVADLPPEVNLALDLTAWIFKLRHVYDEIENKCPLETADCAQLTRLASLRTAALDAYTTQLRRGSLLEFLALRTVYAQPLRQLVRLTQQLYGTAADVRGVEEQLREYSIPRHRPPMQDIGSIREAAIQCEGLDRMLLDDGKDYGDECDSDGDCSVHDSDMESSVGDGGLLSAASIERLLQLADLLSDSVLTPSRQLPLLEPVLISAAAPDLVWSKQLVHVYKPLDKLEMCIVDSQPLARARVLLTSSWQQLDPDGDRQLSSVDTEALCDAVYSAGYHQVRLHSNATLYRQRSAADWYSRTARSIYDGCKLSNLGEDVLEWAGRAISCSTVEQLQLVEKQQRCRAEPTGPPVAVADPTRDEVVQQVDINESGISVAAITAMRQRLQKAITPEDAEMAAKEEKCDDSERVKCYLRAELLFDWLMTCDENASILSAVDLAVYISSVTAKPAYNGKPLTGSTLLLVELCMEGLMTLIPADASLNVPAAAATSTAAVGGRKCSMCDRTARDRGRPLLACSLCLKQRGVNHPAVRFYCNDRCQEHDWELAHRDDHV